MNHGSIATASTTIRATRAAVWHALVTPAAINQYLFTTAVISEWVEGSSIVWRYEEKGLVLQLVPDRLLEYSRFSPLAGLPDAPENYPIVTVELSSDGPRTRVTLSQDNNPTDRARAHAEKKWASILAAVRQFVERRQGV